MQTRHTEMPLGPTRRLSSLMEHQPMDSLADLIRRLDHFAASSGGQYALMYYDGEGKGQITGSNEYRPHIQTFFPPAVQEKARNLAMNVRRNDLNMEQDQAYGRKMNLSQRTDVAIRAYPSAPWAGSDPMLRDVNTMASAQTTWPPENASFSFRKRASQAELQPSNTKRKSVSGGQAARDAQRATEMTHEIAEKTNLLISDEEAVANFYLTRFRQMQQLMCKVVAKSWIKVIEPKKQTNFPYNRGESTKPKWWPEDVRHKEPDHLMKPERLQLMLTMIRCRIVPIETLDKATGIPEVLSQIPPERMPLLEEVYRVAKKEEQYKEGLLPPMTYVQVLASDKHIKPVPKKKPSTSSSTNSASATFANRAPKLRRDSGSSGSSGGSAAEHPSNLLDLESPDAALVSPGASPESYITSPGYMHAGLESPAAYNTNTPPAFTTASPLASPLHPPPHNQYNMGPSIIAPWSMKYEQPQHTLSAGFPGIGDTPHPPPVNQQTEGYWSQSGPGQGQGFTEMLGSSMNGEGM